ncbi:MAG: single-stranded DNA-binding protein, partial [Alphaproteobacteria bacterium]|nr:single-stranded DNA-binding protein [Alphaproteobacteria bacterium]
QTRKWRKDGEDSDRFSTEILLVPGGRVQFLDRPAGANGNGAAPANGDDAAPASADAQGTSIPF